MRSSFYLRPYVAIGVFFQCAQAARDMTRYSTFKLFVERFDNLHSEEASAISDQDQKLFYLDGVVASTQWQSGLAVKMTLSIFVFLSAAGVFWCFDHQTHREEVVSDKVKRGVEHANSDGMLDDRQEDVEPQEQPLVYRPELDGMRAIAVIGVVFFHFDVENWKGGFVGVDVFYVISGYLITRIVFTELSLELPLWDFWVRRARRLFPALFVLLCATVAAGWHFQSPERYQSLLEQVRYVLLCAANIRFYASLDYYFNPYEAPLLHMWSLAVEEQFYAIYPFVVWMFWRCKRRKMWIFLVCMATFTSSIALSIAYSSTQKRFSYYMTPPRAFQLTIGCLLAFDTGLSPFSNRAVAELCSWCGLAMILTAYFTYEISMDYPSYFGLLPCMGGALVIASNRIQRTFCGMALSQWPLVIIGKISYSWYLWHWPVNVFMGYYYLQSDAPYYGSSNLDTYHKWLGIGLSLVAAFFSYFFVEQPFRTKMVSNRVFFIISCIAWVALFGYTFRSCYIAVPDYIRRNTKWW